MYKEKFQKLGLLSEEFPEELAEKLWKGLLEAFEYYPSLLSVNYQEDKEKAFEKYLEACIEIKKLEDKL